MKSKYDSSYYNDEKYYDPTAGAALAGLIREERQRRYRPVPKRQNAAAPGHGPELSGFLKDYEQEFKTEDPAKRARKRRRVRSWIHAYEYIMKICDRPDFSVDKAAAELGLSPKRIQQIFDGRGDIACAVRAWNNYKRGLT